MGIFRNMIDGLANAMSGLGTTADKSVFGHYRFSHIPMESVESAYRTSWLMRQIVDIPGIDMTRAWRAWQADRETIAKLEKEEARLMLRHKAKRALILARLWGGAALVLGDGSSDESLPLDPRKIGQGGLQYVALFARSQITTGELEGDPASPYYGTPKFYQITPKLGSQVTMHPSRVIPFVGNPVPEGSTMVTDSFWGDPLYQSIQKALHNAENSSDGFASLVDEAKVDVIKIPDLMKNIGSDAYEQKLLSRLSTAKTGKSIWRALVIDGDEEWEQKEIRWAGIPEVIMTYMQIVAGAADIPVTRLLGTSPRGLQSTGEGEEKDYHAMIEARQDELLMPALMRIDELLVRSALGEYPEELWWKFNPLARETKKQAMEVEKDRALTLKRYADAGIINPDVLARMAEGAITESGQWPGSDEAFDKYRMADPDEGRESPEDDPEEMAALQLAEDRWNKGKRRIMRDARIEDGIARPLYVSRRVMNAGEIMAHFERQGISPMLPADELHVTVIFSRAALDWMLIDPDWSVGPEGEGTWTIPPGGPRQMLAFGAEQNALVLAFNDLHLEWRHKHMIERGASYDHGDYQPHMTISHQQFDLDDERLAEIEPWQGPIVLGPEIFAIARDNWAEGIEEK